MRSRGRQSAAREQPWEDSSRAWLTVLEFRCVILRVWFFSSGQLELQQYVCSRKAMRRCTCLLPFKENENGVLLVFLECVHVQVRDDFQEVLSFHYRCQGLSSVPQWALLCADLDASPEKSQLCVAVCSEYRVLLGWRKRRKHWKGI